MVHNFVFKLDLAVVCGAFKGPMLHPGLYFGKMGCGAFMDYPFYGMDKLDGPQVSCDIFQEILLELCPIVNSTLNVEYSSI